MAKGPEIQYIRLYTEGSTARSVDFNVPQKKRNKTRLPKLQPQKKRVIRLDPMALMGMLVAGVMMILMVVGCVQLNSARQEAERYSEYVVTLQDKNTELQKTYQSGYDLEQIEEMAIALGMVPREQAQHVEVRVEIPEISQEPTGWERFTTFLAGLFA
jgi:hypothetical protein